MESEYNNMHGERIKIVKWMCKKSCVDVQV